MRFIKLNSNPEYTQSILFFNGGGQIVYSKNHPIVKYFSKFKVNLLSVELPGHGNSSFDRILDEDEFVNTFIKDFNNLYYRENIILQGLVGFSLGGLLILKLLELNYYKPKFSLVYGAGLGVGENEIPTFDYYISEEFFQKMNWMNIMKKNHGDGWLYLLKSIAKSLLPKNKIFANPRKLIDNPTYLLIILGEDEELFSPEVTKSLLQENGNIKLLTIANTSHFEYFSKSKHVFLEILHHFDIENNWFNV